VYVRVSILGSLVSGEVWSVNPVFDPTGEFTPTVSQSALDAAALAIANRSLPATLGVALSASGTRTGARVEVRDDATDALIATSTQQTTGGTAGSGTLRLPPQSAAVVSIRTNTAGGSGRGRLYWPSLGATLGTDGRITIPAVATFVTDFKSYLMGMRTDLATAFAPIGFDLAVRSKTTHTTPHAVRIQVGNVVDTQRRRRDALPEAYSTATVP
jgi:hypothetical protein